jgi:hypothetical protein
LGAIIEESPENAEHACAPRYGPTPQQLTEVAWSCVTVEQTARHAKSLEDSGISSVFGGAAPTRWTKVSRGAAYCRGHPRCAARRGKVPDAAQKIHGCQDSERLLYDFRANAWAFMHATSARHLP